jgi:type IV secretion system protein VirB4
MADPFARRFLPQIGYWNANTGIMQSGAVFAVLHAAGHASDLASARAMIAARDQFNMTLMNISNPNLEIWIHFVRASEQKPTVLPPADTWFGRRFDAAYRACLEDGLFRNDLFITFVLRPEFDLRKTFRKLLGRGPRAPRDLPNVERTMEQDFEALVGSAEAELRRYGVRRLGIRREGERTFMEIAEALHYILHGYARKIGTIAGTGRMGRLICPSRPVFGHKAYRLDNDLGKHVGTVLSMMDYPEPVTPTMFEALVRAPFACTLTNSFQFRSRAKAMSKLVFTERQMRSANDPAKSQLAAVERAKDELQSRAYVNGEHHFALAVRAPTLEALDRAAADAATMLSNAGITAVRENEALRAAFYAQLPGNPQWRPRTGGINSRNLASLAALNNVPAGQARSRWGAPVMMLRTTADTEYALHLQAQGSPSIPAEDLANILAIGRSGSGKTTLMGAVTVLSGRQGVQRVVIDKDLGLAPCIEACGGDYLVIPANEDTGVAPLLAAQDTPQWRAHVEDLVIDLIQAGGNPVRNPTSSPPTRMPGCAGRWTCSCRCRPSCAGLPAFRPCSANATKTAPRPA